jgi:hypothetical protein
VRYTSRSYWRYALFSTEPISQLLADVGGAYLVLEVLDFFQVYPRERHTLWTLVGILLLSVAHVLVTRRPVSRVTYKVPKKDLCYEVRIDDLFACPGEIVVSAGTTFDTDVASGLIAPNSIQGQLSHRFFNDNTEELDRQIEVSLDGVPSEQAISPGKRKRYPIGTVAKVNAHGKNFYLLAMAELNEHGNAQSSPEMVDEALEKLWAYMAERGEHGDVVLPLVGTGRGRIQLPRKKIIERIAQSFAYASRERTFANRLIIVVHPDDAAKYDVNLFEVRDYLVRSLDV